MKTSEQLVAGAIYTRLQLREQFGIIDATLNNGIFRPKGHESVWLFVTVDKSADRTQYTDKLSDDVLEMDGQLKGRTDQLIVDHAKDGRELLLFYREHKQEFAGGGFRYEGPFLYQSHAGSNPTHFTLIRSGRFKHGAKRTWELALHAIQELGGRATFDELAPRLLEKHAEYKLANLRPDLSMLSVNDPNRTHFPQTSKPRITSDQNEYDKLYRAGSYFERYDPLAHGVWEIYPDEQSTSRFGTSIRLSSSPIPAQLEAAESDAQKAGAFEVSGIEDARNKVLASIVRRRGQPAFRAAQIERYGGACAVTGCSVAAVLEAAHIFPYMDGETNAPSNGLLLRSDIHALFDLKLISVDPKGFSIVVAPGLMETEYGMLHGQKIRATKISDEGPSVDALAWHRSQCSW